MASIRITGAGGHRARCGLPALEKGTTRCMQTVHVRSPSMACELPLQSCGENSVWTHLSITESKRHQQSWINWDMTVLTQQCTMRRFRAFSGIDLERVKAVCESNVFSALQLTQRVVPKLIAKGEGRVIFMGSMAGLTPTPFLRALWDDQIRTRMRCVLVTHGVETLCIKVIIINPGCTKRASMRA